MCYMLTMHLITKKVKLDVVRQAIEQKLFIMMLFVAWEKSNAKQPTPTPTPPKKKTIKRVCKKTGVVQFHLFYNCAASNNEQDILQQSKTFSNEMRAAKEEHAIST